MSTNADAPLVSRAVEAFTGWGRAKTPQSDHEAVAALAAAHDVDPAWLIERVTEAIASSESLDTSSIDPSGSDAGPRYKEMLRLGRPDLGPGAVDALASRWFYRRVWLGSDTPVVAEPNLSRYFTLFGLRGRTRVPQALFRRRVIDGVVTDEVLRDLDQWAPDLKGKVANAVDRPTESDLEEISAARAEEFMRMVANRTYDAFTAE